MFSVIDVIFFMFVSACFGFSYGALWMQRHLDIAAEERRKQRAEHLGSNLANAGARSARRE